MTKEVKNELIKMKAGNINSFEYIYYQFINQIYNKTLLIVKEEEIAKDISQQTFIKIWHIRESIDTDKPFQLFIYQISNNLAIDYLRKVANDRKKIENLYNLTSKTTKTVEDQFLIKESQNMIYRLISKLPKQQQQVFKLCKLEGFTYAEAAEILGISKSTVSNHLTSATKFIKEILLKNKNKIHFIILYISIL